MITPLDSTIKGVMEFTWPMVIICILIASSIRIIDLIKNKKEFVFYKEVLALFFMIYILCLFQTVTFEDQSLIDSNSNFNLIPFKEILRYHIGSRLFFKNVIGNLVLFMPYGFFASYYIKADKKVQALFLVLFASFSIELTQFAIGRVFDIDDIILNVIGGMIGYFIFRILSRIGDFIPKVFLTNWFLNILSSLLVILFLTYVWVVFS